MEKDKFQPIVMPCTKEQYKSLIPVLEKNNIIYDKYQGSFNGIVNNFNSYDNCVGKITNFNNTHLHVLRNRKYYQRFNRKIFLKSLGIVEEPEFVLPEKWFVTYANYEEFNIINKHFKKGWVHLESVNKNGYFSSDNKLGNNWIITSTRSPYCKKSLLKKGYVEITFEQFQKYVLKQDISILESQSITNKQPKMKSTVNEIKQSEPTIKKGLLVVTQERVGIVTKYISDNNFDVTILHPSAHHGLIVTNLNHTVIRIFKGKLTLEQ